MSTYVKAHQFVDPDPEDELEFMEEMVEEIPQTVAKNLDNLGSGFHRSLRLLGYRVHLNKPKAQLVAALRTIVELGVALFQRGRANPGHKVTVEAEANSIAVVRLALSASRV